MKSEERDNLKKNELGEVIFNEAPAYIKENKNRIITITIVVFFAIFGYYYIQNLNQQSRQIGISNIDNAVSGRYQAQSQAASGASGALEAKDASLLRPYNVDVVSDTLSSIVNEKDFGMMALYQKAELERSKLFFGDKVLTQAEKDKILDTAGGYYQDLKKRYSDNFFAVGNGQLGLGLIAEEKSDFQQARAIYEAMIADKVLANTGFPGMAQSRLEVIEELQDRSFEFTLDPEGPELPESQQ